MLKSLRKYNKWFLVAFGVLLMLAWLSPQAGQGMNRMKQSRVVAKLDGKGITAQEMQDANKEIAALDAFSPALVSNYLAIQDRDPTHWLLLVREAQAAGLVGDAPDGRTILEQVSRAMAEQRLRSDFQLIMALQQQPDPQAAIKQYIESSVVSTQMALNRQGMSEREIDMLFARLGGVDRLIRSYRQAARVSDRQAVFLAKHELDAAVADYVFIPASLSSDKLPDPDEAALQAHFEKFKNTKPGEGEFGIGYIHPPQVKIEWMALEAKAFEDAVQLDPVEVRKRFQSNKARYAGDFATEKPNVERDMKAERVERAMQDVQRIVQSEVLKTTRRLEPDGRYKKLPADWEQARPRLETIAQSVASELKKEGLEIPLPPVTSKAGSWLTLAELQQLPGIGFASMRLGGINASLGDIVGSTKELGAQSGPLAIQVGIPIAESPLTDGAGNRYYITVLATRPEAPTESLAEVREQALKDYKLVQAFENLKAKADELRQVAAGGGLDAVVAAVKPPPPEGAAPDQAPELKVSKAITISRQSAGGMTELDDPELRAKVVAAAAALDPMSPFGSAAGDQSTLVLPAPKHLGVAIFRLQAVSPLTREMYRLTDGGVVAKAQQDELPALPGSESDPFTLANLLKRHDFTSGDERIRTTDQLRRQDETEG